MLSGVMCTSQCVSSTAANFFTSPCACATHLACVSNDCRAFHSPDPKDCQSTNAAHTHANRLGRSFVLPLRGDITSTAPVPPPSPPAGVLEIAPDASHYFPHFLYIPGKISHTKNPRNTESIAANVICGCSLRKPPVGSFSITPIRYKKPRPRNKPMPHNITDASIFGFFLGFCFFSFLLCLFFFISFTSAQSVAMESHTIIFLRAYSPARNAKRLPGPYLAREGVSMFGASLYFPHFLSFVW